MRWWCRIRHRARWLCSYDPGEDTIGGHYEWWCPVCKRGRGVMQ